MPKPTITFETLREIAESASGMRDQDLWFVVTGSPPTYSWSTRCVHAGDDTEVIHVAASRDPVSTVDCAQIGAPGGEPVDLLGITIKPIAPHPGGTYAADAVFWSVSAVEKFLVPYYASVYGDQGPKMAQAVLDVLLPESAEGGEGRVEGETPFAVAHLPSSEYVGEPEADSSFVPRLVALHPSGHGRRVRLAPRAQGR
ncbi:MAG TPA: hypothetical protein VK358_07135 [Longimicrobium sp.]|nr:hypothetical protein [Longimicrobium sp.]